MIDLNFARLILPKIALASSLATIPIAPSLAAIVNYQLVGAIDSGSLVGETYSGSFSFDDSGLTGLGFEDLPVSTVKFNFLGSTYTKIEAIAPPTVEFLDGSFRGLSFSVDRFDPSFSFITGIFDVSESYFAYSPTSREAGSGDVQYTSTPVPESSLIIGLLALSALEAVAGLKRIWKG